MRIVLSGPPGAGKGPVAKALSAQDGAVPISAGDLLRSAVGAGTPLGRRAEAYMSCGELVPDAIIRDLVEGSIRACAGGFILCGFPRTIPQAVTLELLLDGLGLSLDLVADLPQAGRPDEAEPAVRTRMRIHRELSVPMLSHYQRKGLLFRVAETDPLAAAALIREAVALRGRALAQ
ncbi:MAG: nucleoside monophosphate kinase [Holophaga sp.]|nr:nucleoside monophosphate kinase [Holophaga sp.]